MIPGMVFEEPQALTGPKLKLSTWQALAPPRGPERPDKADNFALKGLFWCSARRNSSPRGMVYGLLSILL